mmetsp:Transcript_33337/g.30303  ORF Transcript_33337/g.30303 Transcript_33337/m.30303 type:complete len:135 (-) Transcript_33337:50-454(-)
MTCKMFTIMGDYLHQNFGYTLYGKGQNLARKAKEAYDKILKEYDCLVFPTLPYRAPKIPDEKANMDDYLQAAFGMVGNTSIFDATGHPVLQIPVGKSEGLPIGMSLVGRHFDEAKLYRIARAWEKEVDWKKVNN